MTTAPDHRLARRASPGLLVASTLLAALALLTAGCATAPPPRPPADLQTGAAAALGEDSAARQILVTLAPQPSFQLPHAGSSGSQYGGGDYETSARTLRVAEAIGRDYGLTLVDHWPITALGVDCVVFALPADRSRDELIPDLEKDRRVESVVPMQLFSAQAKPAGSAALTAPPSGGALPSRPAAGPVAFLPGGAPGDDPYRDLQPARSALGLEEAQRFSTGAGVRVVIVDTGVDASHPDLAGRIALARDFIGDDARAVPAERHGTAVAGIIASRRGNGIGIVGVAPDAKLVALRGCWQAGADAIEARCSTFTLAKALAFALEQRPQVINLSLGGRWDPLLARLVRVAIDRGILVVAARGKAGESDFPGSVPGVVAVAASDAALVAGEAASEATGRTVNAPGAEILTTLPGGHYDFLSGSSFAAAQVSGVAALLLQGRRMAPAELLALLRDTSRPLAGEDATARVVDACAALSRLDGSVACAHTVSR